MGSKYKDWHNCFLSFSVGELSCQLLRAVCSTYDRTGHPTNHFNHKHPFTEIHYVTHGHCSYRVGDVPYALTPHQLLLIPPDTQHMLDQVSSPLHRLVLSLHIQHPSDQTGSSSRALYTALHPSTPTLLGVPQKSTLADALQHIVTLSDQNRGTLSAQEAMRAYANLLLAGLAEVLLDPPAIVPPAHAFAPQSFLIDQFFCYPATMSGGAEALAEMLNVSPRQLDRILLDAYGMNFRDKLNQTKLNYAIDLLSNQTLSIGQIAQMLDYSSSTAFGAFIKKLTGQTPSQLRRSSRRPDTSF